MAVDRIDPQPSGTRPEAARAIGLQIQILKASTSREIEAAFATIVRDRADALFVQPDGLFNDRRVQFATLATRHGIPAAYGTREIVEAGWADELWERHFGHVSSSRCLYWSNPEGR